MAKRKAVDKVESEGKAKKLAKQDDGNSRDDSAKTKSAAQPWAPEEDQFILEGFFNVKRDWDKLAKDIHARFGKTRTKESIRIHWSGSLKDKIMTAVQKGAFK